MRNARFWLWGFVPLLILWFAANHLVAPDVTADLSNRVAAALEGAGAGWANVEVLGRDVRITATAPDSAGKTTALAAAGGVSGVRRVNENVDVLATQQPFTLRAERKGDSIMLGGYVPGEAARAQVLAEVARLFPGARVEGNLEAAAGAPKNFSQIVTFALTQLGRLSEGDASISDTTIAISGRARDLASYAAFADALKAAPDGITITSANIIPPTVSPYLWSAERRGDVLALAGYAPDRPTREANAAAAKQKFPDLKVNDGQVLALGQSAFYGRAVQTILDALTHLSAGTGRLEGDAVAISGSAPDAASRSAINDLLKAAADAGLKTEMNVSAPEPPPPPEPSPPPPPQESAQTPPSGAAPAPDASAPAPQAEPPPAPAAEAAPAKPEVAASPPPPPAPPKVEEKPSDVVVSTPEPKTEAARDCGQKVQDSVKRRLVHFARSSAEIGEKSTALIADIGAALKSCGKVSIAVEGHTDNEGRAFNNQRLSEVRAAAVRDALVAQGVSPSQISSAGFGWTRPLVPNTSKENMAKNRRVEFVIR